MDLIPGWFRRLPSQERQARKKSAWIGAGHDHAGLESLLKTCEESDSGNRVERAPCDQRPISGAKFRPRSGAERLAESSLFFGLLSGVPRNDCSTISPDRQACLGAL
jgi:hypothetical protein